ncbi:MAG: hypothetical protein PHV78_02035 [Patescibacteria group bacterium]|nr:hypothetical protein [Patescibacteria group bacterium]MDD5121072.1 hypothetical protein [Patescibacteria group bacterium]MDD5221566.1 hypothetical protein [Patescibacteria group bacterium]MDD5396009.1 hypothetical protein [Patescibacteria group bacterium]
MECRQKNNIKNCPCTWPNCENKGICCLCLKYHRDKKELPACCFSPEVEKTFDRSIKKFLAEQ